MSAVQIPFQTTDWNSIPETIHKGETGFASWRTIQYADLRIRMVDYSENYFANHWCQTGHIIYCVEGEMITELEDGSKFILKQGMSYQVSDGLSSHRSHSEKGCRLFIVDGAFLKNQ